MARQSTCVFSPGKSPVPLEFGRIVNSIYWQGQHFSASRTNMTHFNYLEVITLAGKPNHLTALTWFTKNLQKAQLQQKWTSRHSQKRQAFSHDIESQQEGNERRDKRCRKQENSSRKWRRGNENLTTAIAPLPISLKLDETKCSNRSFSLARVFERWRFLYTGDCALLGNFQIVDQRRTWQKL